LHRYEACRRGYDCEQCDRSEEGGGIVVLESIEQAFAVREANSDNTVPTTSPMARSSTASRMINCKRACDRLPGRLPDANFVSPAEGHVGDQSVKAARSEQDCDAAEEAGERCHRALALQRVADLGL